MMYFLQSFCENFSVPVLVIRESGTILFANRAFQQTFGWVQDDLIKKSVCSCFPEYYHHAVQDFVRQVWNVDDHIPAMITQCQTPSGQVRDVLLDGSRIAEDSGKIEYIILTMRDISNEQRIARSHRVLLRISEKLHHVHGVDDLLEYITKEVQTLLDVGGAMVLLADEDTGEFFFSGSHLG